jgi:hypothetical protein
MNCAFGNIIGLSVGAGNGKFSWVVRIQPTAAATEQCEQLDVLSHKLLQSIL